MELFVLFVILTGTIFVELVRLYVTNAVVDMPIEYLNNCVCLVCGCRSFLRMVDNEAFCSECNERYSVHHNEVGGMRLIFKKKGGNNENKNKSEGKSSEEESL